MRITFFVAGLIGALALAGCKAGSAPPLQLGKYDSSRYTYVVVTGRTPLFQQSTFSQDRADSSKKWLTSSSFSPQRVADQNTQDFLNGKDPIVAIRENVQGSFSRHLGWRKAGAAEADFVVNIGTSSWRVKNTSGFGGYHLYYYAYLNISDKKESDAVHLSKSSEQAKAAIDARTSSPLQMECRYKSEKSYEFAEITSNRAVLTQELANAAEKCSATFDDRLSQR